jgi:hypothetical protein
MRGCAFSVEPCGPAPPSLSSTKDGRVRAAYNNKGASALSGLAGDHSPTGPVRPAPRRLCCTVIISRERPRRRRRRHPQQQIKPSGASRMRKTRLLPSCIFSAVWWLMTSGRKARRQFLQPAALAAELHARLLHVSSSGRRSLECCVGPYGGPPNLNLAVVAAEKQSPRRPASLFLQRRRPPGLGIATESCIAGARNTEFWIADTIAGPPSHPIWPRRFWAES